MLEELRSAIEQPFPFITNCGLKLEALEFGYTKLVMPLGGNGNHINTMYAGALFTLSEMAGGALSIGSFDMNVFYPIIKDMQIKYKAPARTDISVEMRLTTGQINELIETASKDGKANFTMETELKNIAGEIVATTAATYQLRKIAA
jgi:acyl-coenzyme A thioesterase PaaI-like protein|tara:strand:+ start:1605 stop:2045 length:441 start_codon:yes stop_codon:yes gene_type:complete